MRETSEFFDITQIILVDGKITAKQPSLLNVPPDTERIDNSISDEIMDMAEMMLDMSENVQLVQAGGRSS